MPKMFYNRLELLFFCPVSPSTVSSAFSNLLLKIWFWNNFITAFHVNKVSNQFFAMARLNKSKANWCSHMAWNLHIKKLQSMILLNIMWILWMNDNNLTFQFEKQCQIYFDNIPWKHLSFIFWDTKTLSHRL